MRTFLGVFRMAIGAEGMKFSIRYQCKLLLGSYISSRDILRTFVATIPTISRISDRFHTVNLERMPM